MADDPKVTVFYCHRCGGADYSARYPDPKSLTQHVGAIKTMPRSEARLERPCDCTVPTKDTTNA